MFPPGHIAFAYLLLSRLTKRHPSSFEFTLLALGSVLPTAVNEALQRWPASPVNHLWSHSFLLLLGFAAAVVVLRILAKRSKARRWFSLLILGFAAHLVSDPAFDMLHLYLDERTDDVGASWLFPILDVNIDRPRLDPGLPTIGWQVALEISALATALAHWINQGALSDSRE